MSAIWKCFFIALIGVSFVAQAQIEKWVDENGKTHYGKRAPSGRDVKSIDVPAYNPAPLAVKTERVALYSTSWCPYCKKAKAYLKNNGIAFTEYDIEKDAAAKRKYDSVGGQGVPFLVKGTDVQAGFSKNKYDLFFGR